MLEKCHKERKAGRKHTIHKIVELAHPRLLGAKPGIGKASAKRRDFFVHLAKHTPDVVSERLQDFRYHHEPSPYLKKREGSQQPRGFESVENQTHVTVVGR